MGRAEPLEARVATFGRIREGMDTDRDRLAVVDQVVATRFAAPHSFTGEDVVELAGHGSPVLLQRIVERACEEGARLAEPGEFTLRAYLNGRIDLVQAEAVADLVNAVTPLQARAAIDQLEGTLTGLIAKIEAELFDLAAKLEASLDFPEEGFHFITREAATEEMVRIREALEQLAAQGRAGRVIREGSLVVIAGRPNAGKSSLFNALVGAPRAIVTDIAGTTRDLLTERVDILGLPVTLVDTAGLREATNSIEAEGIKRALSAREAAALTLLVVDGSEATDTMLPPASDSRQIIVVSKCDLAVVPSLPQEGLREDIVSVSVVSGEGLDALRRRIVRALTERDHWRDPPALSNQRHLALVTTAIGGLAALETFLADGATEELVLAELGRVRLVLEEITGRRSPDELLHHIFSTFCVGK